MKKVKLYDLLGCYKLVDSPFIDLAKIHHRSIVFTGPGWYSLSDDNVSLPGKFATYSRIKVV